MTAKTQGASGDSERAVLIVAAYALLNAVENMERWRSKEEKEDSGYEPASET